MIRLIAPRAKVLPWLDKQDARWRALGLLPIETEAEWLHAAEEMHRAYQTLFEGLSRAFKTTEQEELNPNLVVMRSAYVGDLVENRPEARRVKVAGMLEVIAEARRACRMS